jgi:hypothetical protein
MSTLKIKEGQIVENYQGKFAKVIAIKDNGIYQLSAWVKTAEAAGAEDRVMVRLNAFGLSQVLKGGENTPGAEAAPAKAEKAEKATGKGKAEKAE